MSEPTGFASKTLTPQQQFDAEMTRRKFSAQVIEKAELTVIDAATATEQVGFSWPQSIRIPYFDLSGKPIEFVRLRRLVDDGKKRYTQRRSSGTHIYFPPLSDWRLIAKDTTVPIVITEGEFKALTVMATGAACLGLAGVTSWGSQTGKPLHDELLPFQWRDRQVHIIFDYDGHKFPNEEREPNAQVKMAEARLAIVLRGLGAKVSVWRIGLLAPSTKQKYAIDDHLNDGGMIEQLFATESVNLNDAQDIKTKLYEFGTQFGFDLNGAVVVLDDGRVLSYGPASVFAGPHRFDKLIPASATSPPGTPAKFKNVALLDEAKVWPRRTVIREVGMFPQYQGMTITPDGCYNLFKDWAHQPTEGDVTPFLEICKYFFQADPSFEEFYHNWVAHLLQKPWLRHYTTIQFIHEAEGVGKSFMSETIAHLIGMKGKNCGASVLGPDSLFGQWSDELAGKVFVVVNEPSSDKSNHSKQLKHFITSPKININKKYGASFSVDNYVNYMFTTNEPFVTQMSEGSRREAIYRPDGVENAVMEPWVPKVVDWLETGGYGKLLNWYLNRDVSEFKHTARAPDSDAKRDAQVASMSEIQTAAKVFAEWVRDECEGDALMSGQCRDQMVERLYGTRIAVITAFHRALAPYCKHSRQQFNDGKKVTGVRYTIDGKSAVELSIQDLYLRTKNVVESWA